LILGIGTDICDIRRIESVRRKFATNFDRRILTPAEHQELNTRSDKNAYVAKRFAAKEAVYKAFNFCNQSKLKWHHAQILNTGNQGAPALSLLGRCKSELSNQLLANETADIHLSLSDEYPYVVAYVILAKRCYPS